MVSQNATAPRPVAGASSPNAVETKGSGQSAASAKTANLAQLLIESGLRFADKPAFATRGPDRVFRAATFGEVFTEARRLATGLIALGLGAREHVALFADNRYEWILCDLAVILCGAADVPRGSDVTEAEIRYIVAHADARFAIVENAAVLDRLMRCLPDLPALEVIILMEGAAGIESPANHRPAVYGLAELKAQSGDGKNLKVELERRIAGIGSDDLFTLIYTSGTTGAPKGVQLTHSNIVSQIKNTPFRVNHQDRILSILPVWHIFERVFEMIAMANGCCTYYTSVRNLKEDMSIVRPTFMASAPRLWESVYQGIRTSVEKAPAIRQALFGMAAAAAGRFRRALRVVRSRDLLLQKPNRFVRPFQFMWSLFWLPFLYAPFAILDTIVLKKVRAATGGRLRGSVSGGGALPLHVDAFFNDIGIPVLEGYGLTETSPVLAVRTFERLVIGTVGPLYPDTELRLLDLNTGEIFYRRESGIRSSGEGRGRRGEIHVRGPQIMNGYYKDAQSTARVLSADGWFNTGDIGLVTYNDCLKIVGRSKDTVVLLGGENVEPVPIENKLLESPYIDQCMIVGQDRKFLCALILPAKDKFGGRDHAELAISAEVRETIRSELRRLVSQESGFKAFERVVDFRLLPKALEPGDELTAKLSIKRHVVTEKYADLIASLYEDGRA